MAKREIKMVKKSNAELLKLVTTAEKKVDRMITDHHTFLVKTFLKKEVVVPSGCYKGRDAVIDDVWTGFTGLGICRLNIRKKHNQDFLDYPVHNADIFLVSEILEGPDAA